MYKHIIYIWSKVQVYVIGYQNPLEIIALCFIGFKKYRLSDIEVIWKYTPHILLHAHQVKAV